MRILGGKFRLCVLLVMLLVTRAATDFDMARFVWSSAVNQQFGWLGAGAGQGLYDTHPSYVSPVQGDSMQLLLDDPNTPGCVSTIDSVSLASSDAFSLIESVIGSDDRMRITPTTGDPWRKIALLLVTFPSGASGLCTGWFIGPDSVVTAGHCVYQSGNLGWATSVTVIPAADGPTAPYGSQSAVNLCAPEGWYISELSTYDYGVVRLPDSTLGDQTGYFTVGYFSNAYLNAGYEGRLAGYPGDKDYGTLWFDFDPIAGVAANILSYRIDTVGGQSGSPVWLSTVADEIVVAIHTRGLTDPACTSGMNCGTRITYDVANNLQSWGAASTPETDCLALNAAIYPLAAGYVSYDPASSSGCPDATFVSGTHVEITAEPETGYQFATWSGDYNGSDNPASLTILDETCVTANFVEAQAGPVQLYSVDIDDDSTGDSSGNADGVANCGELVELGIGVENAGLSTAVGVTATLTTTDSLVQVINAQAFIGDITAQSIITHTAANLIDIAADYEGTVQANLEFVFVDASGYEWYDTYQLDIYCPATNLPPYVPSDPQPANGALQESLDVVLTWLGGDPDGDTVTYDVYFERDDNSPDARICDDSVLNECDVGQLDSGATYYWQVIARDEPGATVTGFVWAFTTIGENVNQPPDKPMLISPEAGSVDQLTHLDLIWSGGDPDDDPVTYTVYADAGAVTPTTIICDELPATTCSVSDLADGTLYSWSVTAFDDSGLSSASDVSTFTTSDRFWIYMPQVLR